MFYIFYMIFLIFGVAILLYNYFYYLIEISKKLELMEFWGLHINYEIKGEVMF